MPLGHTHARSAASSKISGTSDWRKKTGLTFAILAAVFRLTDIDYYGNVGLGIEYESAADNWIVSAIAGPGVAARNGLGLTGSLTVGRQWEFGTSSAIGIGGQLRLHRADQEAMTGGLVVILSRD